MTNEDPNQQPPAQNPEQPAEQPPAQNPEQPAEQPPAQNPEQPADNGLEWQGSGWGPKFQPAEATGAD